MPVFEHNWSSKAWMRRLLGRDAEEWIDWFRELGEALGDRRFAAEYVRLLAVTFLGRVLADLCVPGKHWRSGLCFTVIPIMAYNGEEYDPFRHRAMLQEKFADRMEMDRARYLTLAEGRVRPTENELERMLALLGNADREQFGEQLQVDWATKTAAAVQRAKEVGGYDPDEGFYVLS